MPKTQTTAQQAKRGELEAEAEHCLVRSEAARTLVECTVCYQSWSVSGSVGGGNAEHENEDETGLALNLGLGKCPGVRVYEWRMWPACWDTQARLLERGYELKSPDVPARGCFVGRAGNWHYLFHDRDDVRRIASRREANEKLEKARMDGTGLRGGYDPSQHYLFTTLKFGARNQQDQARIAAYLEENLNGWLTWEQFYSGPSGTNGLWYATGKLEIPRLAEETYGQSNWLLLAERHLLARDRDRSKGTTTTANATTADPATTHCNGGDDESLWEGVVARRKDLTEYEQATGRKFYAFPDNAQRPRQQNQFATGSTNSSLDAQIDAGIAALGLSSSSSSSSGSIGAGAGAAEVGTESEEEIPAIPTPTVLNLFGEPIPASAAPFLYRRPYSSLDYFCRLPSVPSIYSEIGSSETQAETETDNDTTRTSARAHEDEGTFNEFERVGPSRRDSFGRCRPNQEQKEATREEAEYLSQQINEKLEQLKGLMRSFRDVAFPELLSQSQPEVSTQATAAEADGEVQLQVQVQTISPKQQQAQQELKEELFYMLCRAAETIIREALPPLDPEKDGVPELRLVKLPKLKPDGRQ
jgi:hypothetical protein